MTGDQDRHMVTILVNKFNCSHISEQSGFPKKDANSVFHVF